METTRYDIWTQDLSDDYALVQDAAATAQDIDDALGSVEDNLTAQIATTNTSVENRGYRFGTTAQMNATPARYMEIWVNTTNNLRYIGNVNGTWRRLEGTRVFPAGGWNEIFEWGAGRSIVGILIPTTLSQFWGGPDETLQITTISAGTGFGGVFLQSIMGSASGGTATEVTLRQLQWGSAVQNSIGFSWQIIRSQG